MMDLALTCQKDPSYDSKLRKFFREDWGLGKKDSGLPLKNKDKGVQR